MTFLVVATLSCAMLVVESTEIGKGVAQRPCLSPDNILNNMLRLERTVTQLASRLKDVEEKQETHSNTTVPEKRQQVAFEVQLLKHMTVGLKEPFKFDHVALNTGNAYNPKSGIFLVPVNGTFFLWANVMTQYADHYFHVGLFREGKAIAMAYTGRSMHYGTATINYVVKLKKGDHVWFAITQHKTDIFGYQHSYYGGMLMYA